MSSALKSVGGSAFISRDPQNPLEVRVDGAYAPDRQVIQEDGYRFVPLKSTNIEVSGFAWDRPLSVVHIKDVIIYNDGDVPGLLWMLSRKVQICFSIANVPYSVHPRMVVDLADTLEEFHQLNEDQTVLPGSIIYLPEACGGFRELDRAQRLEIALKNVGFQTVPNLMKFSKK